MHEEHSVLMNASGISRGDEGIGHGYEGQRLGQGTALRRTQGSTSGARPEVPRSHPRIRAQQPQRSRQLRPRFRDPSTPRSWSGRPSGARNTAVMPGAASCMAHRMAGPGATRSSRPPSWTPSCSPGRGPCFGWSFRVRLAEQDGAVIGEVGIERGGSGVVDLDDAHDAVLLWAADQNGGVGVGGHGCTSTSSVDPNDSCESSRRVKPGRLHWLVQPGVQAWRTRGIARPIPSVGTRRRRDSRRPPVPRTLCTRLSTTSHGPKPRAPGAPSASHLFELEP